MSIDADFLSQSIALFRSQKALADGAMRQVDEAAFQHIPYADGNSIAIVVAHMVGNMHSRWTDFLTTDGEKPWRQRDAEFTPQAITRDAWLTHWEAGWLVVFNALESLTPTDLAKTVTIRGQPLTVMQAILRQVSHYGYHVGQIVLLARQSVGADWQSLSIPRGQSQAFTDGLRSQAGDRA